MDGHVKRVKCICCEGEEIECPLCDNVRFFEYYSTEEIEGFMIDFYSETILDATPVNRETLDDELSVYFSK